MHWAKKALIMCSDKRTAQGGREDDHKTCGNGGLKGGYRAGSKVLSCGGSGGESGIFDRLASFPDHFWLLYEDEKLVSMINGMANRRGASDRRDV